MSKRNEHAFGVIGSMLNTALIITAISSVVVGIGAAVLLIGLGGK